MSWNQIKKTYIIKYTFFEKLNYFIYLISSICLREINKSSSHLALYWLVSDFKMILNFYQCTEFGLVIKYSIVSFSKILYRSMLTWDGFFFYLNIWIPTSSLVIFLFYYFFIDIFCYTIFIFYCRTKVI